MVTAASGGTQISTATTFASAATVYAHWTLKGYGSWSGWSTTKYTASSTRKVETKTENVQTGTKTQYSYYRCAYKGNTWNNVHYDRNIVVNQLGYTTILEQTITLDYALTRYDLDSVNCDRYVGYYLQIPGATLDWVQEIWYKQTTSTVPVYSNVTYYRYCDLIE